MILNVNDRQNLPSRNQILITILLFRMLANINVRKGDSSIYEYTFLVWWKKALTRICFQKEKHIEWEYNFEKDVSWAFPHDSDDMYVQSEKFLFGTHLLMFSAFILCNLSKALRSFCTLLNLVVSALISRSISSCCFLMLSNSSESFVLSSSSSFWIFLSENQSL